MKKTLLNKKSNEQLIERVKQLTSQNKALWGEMNATEMLKHCNLCNQQILEGNDEKIKPSLKQNILKFLSLYLVPHFPKHLKGAHKNDTKGLISQDQFENEKQSYITILQNFLTHPQELKLTHIAFGNLSTSQWGVAAWKHMDHHLRQFGV